MRNDVLDTPSSLDDFALGNASCPGSRRVASSSEESCSTTYCLLDCPVWGGWFCCGPCCLEGFAIVCHPQELCDSQHLRRFNLDTLVQGKEFSSSRTPSLSVAHPIFLATWPYIFILDTLSTCLILYWICKTVFSLSLFFSSRD